MVEPIFRLGSRFSKHPSLTTNLAAKRSTFQQCKGLRGTGDTVPVGCPLHLCSFTRRRQHFSRGLPEPLIMGQKLSRRSVASMGSVLRAQDRDAAVERDSVGTAPTGLWIVVGLGNPGPKFAGNRHNVGFMAVDQIAKQEGTRIEKKLSKAAVARCKFGGHSILLAKPLTYMNLSGESVKGLAQFYKVPTDNILIIYDDLDTPLGSVKLKEKGGHGGHNGIRSLGAHIKGNFPRIKIGIGRPQGSRSVIDHVLQDFTAKEKMEVDFAINEAIRILESVLRFGMQRALSGMRY